MILLLVNCFISYLGNFLEWDSFLIKTSTRYIAWFALGGLFETIRIRMTGVVRGHRLFMVNIVEIMFAVCSFLVSVIGFITKSLDGTVVVIFNTWWLICIADLCGRNIKRRSIIHKIGEYSFYIYLFHEPLNFVVLKWFFICKSESLRSVDALIYVFLRIVGVVVVSVFLGLLCNNVKARIDRVCKELVLKA